MSVSKNTSISFKKLLYDSHPLFRNMGARSDSECSLSFSEGIKAPMIMEVFFCSLRTFRKILTIDEEKSTINLNKNDGVDKEK